MSECREAEGRGQCDCIEGWSWKEAKGWEGKEGRREMLVLCSRFRCRGNPSAACVASAQQCASDSPDPGTKNKKQNNNKTSVTVVKDPSERKQTT